MVSKWHDLNRNSDYDDGRSAATRTAPFVETTGAEFETVPKGVNPTRSTKQDCSVSSSGAGREFCRATGVYARTMNTNRIQNNFRPYEAYNIPVTNQDPGVDGELGTADDGHDHVTMSRPVIAGAQFEERW
jgi:hypothetical protein